MTNKRTFFLLTCLLLAFVSACSAKSGRVEGLVTFKGEPLPGGTITLCVAMEDGNPGATFRYVIRPDGTFSGTDIADGDFLVAVDTEGLNPNPPDTSKSAQGMAQKKSDQQMMEKMKQMNNVPAGGGGTYGTYVKIPAKYSDPKTSGLKTKVEKGKNKIKIELTE
jgi:hypothetical protein